MSFTIAPLAAACPDAVEALLDEAFGRDRHGRTAYRIRAACEAIPALSFAAFDGDMLLGSLQSWPIEVADAPLVLVGPVAVAPARQGAGVGSALMDRLIASAPTIPMAMIGDPDYYRRWGFSTAATAGWSVPGPVERTRLLARAADALPIAGMLGPRRFALAQVAA